MMNIKFPVISGLIQNLTKLNDRKARIHKLETEANLIREQNKRDDTVREQRDADLRPYDLPQDAVLVLQKSMEVKRDDVAYEEQRADRRRDDQRYEDNQMDKEN